MFWLFVALAFIVAGLGSINQNSARTAQANEGVLYIALHGKEAYERKLKTDALARKIVNAIFIFLAVWAITALTSCAPAPISIVPSYAYQASYTPNDQCVQYIRSKSNDYVNCHLRLQKEAERQRSEQEHLANIKAYNEAEQKHICNSINPDGCLSPEAKRQNQVLVDNARNAAACEYGDQAACRAYPGGPSEAMDEYHQMKLRDCFMSFDGLPDYYGTKHLACR